MSFALPSFSLEEIFNGTLMANVFGIPEVMALLSGAAAFIIAAVPRLARLPKAIPTLVAAVVLAIGYLFDFLKSTPGFILVFMVSLILAGALIGYWIRTVATIRRMWFAFGVLLAVSLGVVIFATGHYGPVACMP